MHGRNGFLRTRLFAVQNLRTLHQAFFLQSGFRVFEKPSYELHDVYRALDVLGAESDLIQIEVYKNSHFLGERNDKIFYYDCSNYYFETEQEDGSKKYDKNKEHRPNPLIQMGLFMNGDGIPLAFSLFPGNANEQTSLKPLEKKDLGDFRYQNWLQMPVNSGTVMT